MPEPLRTDGSNEFARHSMAVRVPRIIGETVEANRDYPQAVLDDMLRLRDEIASDAPLRLFALPSPDHDFWAPRFSRFEGETWLDTEWFFAEMLSYRLLMAACRYWTLGRDPFAPFKREEMASDALWSLLDEALAPEGPLEERLAKTLHFNLWGNRIDLSLSNVAQKGTGASDEHLLTDHTAAAVDDLLRSGEAGRAVHVIMDNAGTEEAMDFVLADLLLESGVADEVVLHVKLLPVLVSDVIAADIHLLLKKMSDRGDAAARLAGRLESAMAAGRLRVVPDAFWNTDARLWELPRRLTKSFEGAAMVVGKGDVNYRRSTDDAVWTLETTLDEAVGSFPAPLLLLRTLKSDTLVDVPTDRARKLDREEPDWRTNGSYGVIQYAFSPKGTADRGL